MAELTKYQKFVLAHRKTSAETTKPVTKEISHYNIIKKKHFTSHKMHDEVVGKATTLKGAQRSVDKRDNDYGAYAHAHRPVYKEETEMNIEIISEEEIVEAAKEVSDLGINPKPFASRKLKDITTGDENDPWTTWGGNTPREKSIIDQLRKNSVEMPPVAGQVLSGPTMKKADFSVKPGEDVSKWKDSNNGTAISSWYNARPLVRESVDKTTPVRSILPHDLEKHWATKHVAPTGSKISSSGSTTIIHHPDYSIHHIENGEKHQKEVNYNSSGAHAEKDKYNIIHHDYGTAYKSTFVSNKKELHFGYVKTTHDEHDAKEFKSKEHAENHINYHSQHLLPHQSYSVHPKRSGQKIKADAVGRKKAHAEYSTAFSTALKGGNNHPETDLKVRVAKQKIRKHTHPGLL